MAARRPALSQTTWAAIALACALGLACVAEAVEAPTLAAGGTTGGGGGVRGRRRLSDGASAGSDVQAQIEEPFTADAGSIVGLVVAMLVSAFASSVGVGGGPIFTPLFAALLQWSLKVSAGLSTAVISAAGLGSLAVRLAARHPADPRRPLVDYERALMLTGPVLIGVTCGVILNIWLPHWILAFVAVLLFAYLTWRTGSSGLRLWRAEQAARRRAAEQAQGGAAVQQQGGGAVAQQGGGGGDAGPGTPPCASTAVGASVRTRQGSMLSRLLSNHHVVADGVIAPELHAAVQEDAATVRHSVTLVSARSQLAAQALHWPAAAAPAAPPPRSMSAGPVAGLEGGWGLMLRRFLGPSASAASSAQRGALPAAGLNCVDEEQPGKADSSDDGSVGEPEGKEAKPPMDVPWGRALGLLLFWGAYLGLQFAKMPFTRCSAGWWALLGATAVLCLSVPFVLWWREYRGAAAWRQAAAAAVGASGSEPSPKPTSERSTVSASRLPPEPWSPGKMGLAMAVSCAAGLIGGMLGIGGGMLMAPLLLELGLDPATGSATSGLIVFLSASSGLVSYGCEHRLNTQYSAIYGGASLLPAAAGTFLIARLVRRSGRTSVLVLLLAATIGLGCAVTIAFAARQAVEDLADGTHVGFDALCGV